MSKGWICLHRALLDWEWYTDPNAKLLFIHCLLKANHKQGKWRGTDIPRGSFITGRKALSEETGLTEQQIRTALKKLISTNEITSTSTNKNSLLTIVKYSDYQDKGELSTSKTTDNPTNEQPTSNQQVTTNNNVNNNNNGTNTKHGGAKAPVFNFKKSLIEIGVDSDVASDWITVRAKKKAANTKTAFSKVESEISKSSLSANQCITMSVEKSWAGFKSDWARNEGAVDAKSKPSIWGNN